MSTTLVHTDIVIDYFKPSGKWYSSQKVAWPIPWVTNEEGMACSPYTPDVKAYYAAMAVSPGLSGKWDGPVVISFLGDHAPILLPSGR